MLALLPFNNKITLCVVMKERSELRHFYQSKSTLKSVWCFFDCFVGQIGSKQFRCAVRPESLRWLWPSWSVPSNLWLCCLSGRTHWAIPGTCILCVSVCVLYIIHIFIICAFTHRFNFSNAHKKTIVPAQIQCKCKIFKKFKNSNNHSVSAHRGWWSV